MLANLELSGRQGTIGRCERLEHLMLASKTRSRHRCQRCRSLVTMIRRTRSNRHLRDAQRCLDRRRKALEASTDLPNYLIQSAIPPVRNHLERLWRTVLNQLWTSQRQLPRAQPWAWASRLSLPFLHLIRLVDGLYLRSRPTGPLQMTIVWMCIVSSCHPLYSESRHGVWSRRAKRKTLYRAILLSSLDWV